ncbi:MAG TPA: hypothetical protein VLB31_09075, partial [Actinomycetota bacterium]|nr:hypothetical protein [Actinomycetota bacterium]
MRAGRMLEYLRVPGGEVLGPRRGRVRGAVPPPACQVSRQDGEDFLAGRRPEHVTAAGEPTPLTIGGHEWGFPSNDGADRAGADGA